MVANGKSKGPRRVIAAALADMKRILAESAEPWAGRNATQVSDPELSKWRRRRPDELPENRAEAWRALLVQMTALRRLAAQVSEAATTQIVELERLTTRPADKDAWMDATPPAELHLEGGGVVEHRGGSRVFNYYDMKAGTIEEPATRPDAPTMPVHALDGGAAWWVRVRHDDGSSAFLDQSRMCSIDTARARGWM